MLCAKTPNPAHILRALAQKRKLETVWKERARLEAGYQELAQIEKAYQESQTIEGRQEHQRVAVDFSAGVGMDLPGRVGSSIHSQQSNGRGQK